MNSFDVIMMMSIPKKCDKCNSKRIQRLSLHTYICEDCNNEMYDDFGKIRNYLEKFPGANAIEISQGTGVSKDVINQCLKEEYLEVVPGTRMINVCTKCGRSTTNIGLCDECCKKQDSFNKNVSSVKLCSSGRFRTR